MQFSSAPAQCADPLRDARECPCARAVRLGDDGGDAAVGVAADAGVQAGCRRGRARRVRRTPRATPSAPKMCVLCCAVRAREHGHVLHHAEDLHPIIG